MEWKLKKYLFYCWVLLLQNVKAQVPELVTDASTSSGLRSINELKGYNGNLYFTGEVSRGRSQLFRSDGTREGTFILKNIVSHNSSGEAGSPGKYVVANNLLFFNQYDGSGA